MLRNRIRLLLNYTGIYIYCVNVALQFKSVFVEHLTHKLYRQVKYRWEPRHVRTHFSELILLDIKSPRHTMLSLWHTQILSLLSLSVTNCENTPRNPRLSRSEAQRQRQTTADPPRCLARRTHTRRHQSRRLQGLPPNQRRISSRISKNACKARNPKSTTALSSRRNYATCWLVINISCDATL